MRHPLIYILAISLCMLFTTGEYAIAQSMAPMQQKVRGFDANFLVQVEVANTYDTPQIASVRFYTDDWQPIHPVYVHNGNRLLSPHQRVVVTAIVPFRQQRHRVVYICNSITPSRNRGGGQSFRGEVCGKVSAQRLS